MNCKRKILTCSLSATLALLATSGGANAACALAGTWHFYAMLGTTPDIKSTLVNVGNSTNNGATTIRVFPSAGVPYKNDTSRALKCVLTVQANGNFAGPCTSYGVAGSPQNVNVSGNLALSACNLTGTVNVPGNPPVTIQGGHINGVSGAGIATQGSKQVLHFSLVKN
ncbi:MAG TPA: hypothetical protein VFK79_03535 [Xanthobacteraceae bacterium]|nr:hypothetical protein [Xanthobacteraceae bacterium]